MKMRLEMLLVVFITVFLLGCQMQEKNSEQENKINIVTSFYPMYIATCNIVDGIENIQLANMTKPEVGCLHDYQLTTKDMNLLEKADIFVINGGGMESFLDKAIGAYPQLKIVNSSEGILEAHEENHEVETHHHEENAHIWVSISMYMEQVKNIAHSLGEIDTEHREKYWENAQNYISKLSSLKEKMHEQLDQLPNRNIVTFHEAFDFFAEEFGLNVVAVIEREPGTSPSAGELARIIDTIQNTKANAIFVEPQYETSIADVIAQETKIPVYSLDPVVTGDFKQDAYEMIMKKNMATLKEALRKDEKNEQ